LGSPEDHLRERKKRRGRKGKRGQREGEEDRAGRWKGKRKSLIPGPSLHQYPIPCSME